MKKIFCNAGADARLETALRVLAEFTPVAPCGDSARASVTCRPGREKGFRTSAVPGGWLVEYSDLASALRGVACAMAGRAGSGDNTFQSTGIMLDVSRNAVMTLPYLKEWLCKFALLGGNRVMLYTEDTYELPGEPMWGYMRGAYSAAELRELDDFAFALGIEMVGCIQTLGHLEHPLAESAYRDIRDTPNVLLADEPATYELIGKMIRVYSENLRSRVIHIGMDEAFGLGLGAFLRKHGFERQFDIFNRHLNRVTAMCREAGMQPMIWSDMYFRMGSKNDDYYDRESEIPEDVAAAIPRDVELVYWDYYHPDEAFYSEWIARHRALGHEPVMASGIWTWANLWYNHNRTASDAGPAIAASRKAGLKHIVFTMWGDDGAYCEMDSALAGVAFVMELCWGGSGREAETAKLCRAVCGLDYSAVLKFAQMENPLRDKAYDGMFFSVGIFWEDPLIQRHSVWLDHFAGPWMDYAIAKYRKGAALPLPPGQKAFRHAALLVRILAEKTAFRRDFLAAYRKRDLRAARELRSRCREMIRLYRKVWRSFREDWLRHNKPMGFELLSHRLGAIIMRYEEISLRLEAFIADPETRIPELDEAAKLPEKAGDQPYPIARILI